MNPYTLYMPWLNGQDIQSKIMLFNAMQLKLKVGKISAVLFNFFCFHSTTNNIFSVIKTTKGTHLTAKDKTETNNYIQPTFHIHFLFMYNRI